MPDRYGNQAAADYLGISGSTWRSYVARGQAPAADGKDEGFGKDYWLKTTLDAWKASRPGRGWHRKSAAD